MIFSLINTVVGYRHFKTEFARSSRKMNTVEEYRLKAKEKLEPGLEKYINGSHNTQTDDNVKAFNNYVIRPYIGCDTTNINTSTTILGHPVAIPLCVAPMERQHFINPKAERITAAAAKKSGVGFSISAWTATKIEDLVADADTGLKFINMYIYKNKSWTEHVVRKAEKCGFHGLLIGFAKTNPAAYTKTAVRSRYANLEDLIPAGLTPRDPDYPLTSSSCSWADIKWLKSITDLPVIAKGILSARDAIQAVNAGVDAVLVSNHGGRQLQGVPAPIDVLPEVAKAVGNRCEVYMDGGVRTGASLFKALALGAKAVFVGRPILWGYACGNEEGIERVLDIYKQELSYTMTLAVNTVEEYRLKAKEKLEPDLEKYISGSHNTQTDDNVKAFNNYLIRPYLATDTTTINLSTSILGHKVSMPFCIAPMGMQKYLNPRAEHVTAAAAKRSGVGFAMSAFASITMDELVTNSNTGLKFLNLYIYKKRSWTEILVKKAEQCGFHGFILGFPKIIPKKHSSIRSTMANLEHLLPANVDPTHPDYPMPDPATSWADVTWLKSITSLPVIAKGVLSARDAIQAANAGVDAVLVSNHGGRQLEGVPAPIDVLPEIVNAVGNRCEVYMDGGVRTGASLFKALALGAKAVFAGRPILWGYACENEEGIDKVLAIYKQELSYTMTMAGVSDVNRIPGDVVIRKEMLARL